MSGFIRKAPAGSAVSELDFYGQPAVDTPHLAYRELLDAGPVVWLPRHKVLAVARFAPLRAMLKADKDFVSSQGVTMNPIFNWGAKKSDTVLVSDGDKHDRLRRVLMAPMRPRALESLRDRIREQAQECVDGVVGRGKFEAMESLASHLPVSIVADLVGLPDAQREKMISWSKATFNLIGPINRRSVGSLPAVANMFKTQRGLDIDRVRPGTWAHRLFQLRDEGEIRHSEALGMMIDYIAPSLDTTIFATGHLLRRLADHPDQWRILRDDPSVIPNAVNESLRIDSVIRAFTRVAARDIEFEGTPILKGQRILAVYGAANRDERHFENPNVFDITRDARDHMAFGHGPHACAGTRLAKIEMEALLEAILERVDRIDVGKPIISNNNTLYGFDALPAELHPS